MSTKSLTAFPLTEQRYRDIFDKDSIDHKSLERPLGKCDIAICQGMCCYDGVYLNEEEAEVVSELWKNEREYFRSLGLDTSLDAVSQAEWNGRKGVKTTTIPRPFSKTVDRFPSFFTDTACIFLTQKGLCGLQVLSESKGMHKWYFKPITCALHPLALSLGKKRMHLPTDEDDPHQSGTYKGYSSQTQCGEMCTGGLKASDVLNEEIDFFLRLVEKCKKNSEDNQGE